MCNDPTEMDYKAHLAVALYRMYKYDALAYYEEVKEQTRTCNATRFHRVWVRAHQSLINLINFA